jgi:hypothetical protein
MKVITDIDALANDLMQIIGGLDISSGTLAKLTCDIYCAIAEHTREIDRKGIE